MKFKLLITLISAHFLFACSTLDRHSTDIELAIQHQSLAKHFEEEAAELKEKINAHKDFLNKFESQRYVYGKHAEDLKAHSQQIILIYEKGIAANKEMAKLIVDSDD